VAGPASRDNCGEVGTGGCACCANIKSGNAATNARMKIIEVQFLVRGLYARARRMQLAISCVICLESRLTKLDSALHSNLFPETVRIVDYVVPTPMYSHHFARRVVFGVVGDSRAVLSTKGTYMEHALNKPIESRRAYQQRRHTIAFGIVIALVIAVALVVLLVA